MRANEVNPAKMTTLFRKEFELCNVKRGETLAILSDLNSRREYVAAAFAAADELGADIYEVCVNSLPAWTKIGVETVGKAKGTLEALSSVDMLVCFHIPLFTKWLKQVRQKGTRVLMVIDSPDLLESLMSPPGLKEATIYAGQRLERAKEMRVISDAGTDLTVSLGEYPTMIQYGFSELPGRYDRWGGGLIHTFPNEGTANGTVVFQPGDMVILPYCRYVQDEVRIEVRDGFIRKIEGGLDAALMSDWLDDNKQSADDMDGHAISHLGWASTRTRAGTTSRSGATIPTTISARCARSPAISCSRPARTRKAAASATRSATTTCRCAAAPCCWTTRRSSRTARWWTRR